MLRPNSASKAFLSLWLLYGLMPDLPQSAAPRSARQPAACRGALLAAAIGMKYSSEEGKRGQRGRGGSGRAFPAR